MFTRTREYLASARFSTPVDRSAASRLPTRPTRVYHVEVDTEGEYARRYAVGEVRFAVLLEPVEGNPAVTRATVPGVPGCVLTLGSPRAALDAAKLALERLLASIPEEEGRALSRAQPPVQPGALRAGSRLEHVSIPLRAAGPA